MTLRLTVFTAVLAALALAEQTALDRYVAKPDPSFKWKLAGSIPCEGCTAQVLDMVSQNWRKPDEVSRTEWQHWVTVIRPEKVVSPIAVLFITGGSNNGRPPTRADGMLSAIAKEIQAVAVELRMVPNQPVRFPGDTRDRTEDSIIAYTWDKFLRGGDEEWPLRLPMTKAAVRAMDAVTAFAKSPEGGGITVDRFIVSGGSKRGWTTWTTGAVDKRVVAIAPLVIDCLNLEKSMMHHWRAYGFWAPAVGDYTAARIMDWMGSKENKALLKIEEPFEYRDRLTMPKYIVNASGDQFFLPDSSQFYFKELKGEKLLRYVPNADHSLRNSDAPFGLTAFLQSVVSGKARPRYSWQVGKDGAIRVKTQDAPTEVRLWQASNPEARDFRLQTIGAKWKSEKIEAVDGVYVGRAPRPEKGFTAYFVELTYPAGKYPLKLTTDVKVVPDIYPHAAPKFEKPR
ncbi:MAG: PhoPQ-activated pathogenicity [Acidobacteria bacterium]|nr:PhoPQ-activated pathogenicity [Acidobacteriota bacterium]